VSILETSAGSISRTVFLSVGLSFPSVSANISLAIFELAGSCSGVRTDVDVGRVGRGGKGEGDLPKSMKTRSRFRRGDGGKPIAILWRETSLCLLFFG
jgi:hypothetical protein